MGTVVNVTTCGLALRRAASTPANQLRPSLLLFSTAGPHRVQSTSHTSIKRLTYKRYGFKYSHNRHILIPVDPVLFELATLKLTLLGI